jgi:hypothetical protein
MFAEGNQMVELPLQANQGDVKVTPLSHQVLSIPFTVRICWLIRDGQRMERVAVLPACWQACRAALEVTEVSQCLVYACRLH